MSENAIYAVLEDGSFRHVGGASAFPDCGPDESRKRFSGRIVVSINDSGEIVGAHIERGKVYVNEDENGKEISVSFGELDNALSLGDNDIAAIFGDDAVVNRDVQAEKQRAYSVIVEYADKIAERITGKYPKSEVSSWPSKLIAAKSYIDGTATDDQEEMLAIEARETGNSIDDIARGIIIKGLKFEKVAAYISGMRRNTSKMIKSASSVSEINSILSKAKDDAEKKLAEILLK